MPEAVPGTPPVEAAVTGCPFTARKLDDIVDIFRSKDTINSAEVNVGLHQNDDELGRLALREFVSGILPFTNGTEHLGRRKVLNALVRPKALEALREDVVVPAVRREMARLLREPKANGLYGGDLSALVERVFIEFSAKVIGLRDVDTDEAITDLRSCALPLFAGLSSPHFDDRAGVLATAVAAKERYVETYYRPAMAYHREQLRKLEAGEIEPADWPQCLMRLMVSGAHESYADDALAIKESMLFFIAATGTSTQAVLSTIDFLYQWFEDHPEDIERTDDLEFLSLALQEAIRLRGPYISYVTRLAGEDIEVSSGTVRKGQEVHLQVPLAGRDPDIYGTDSNTFNPYRELAQGVSRYGVAFVAGPHSCLGLRAVLGNDGRSGSHIRVLHALFAAGVRPDTSQERTVLKTKDLADAVEDIPTYRTFPVEFTNWNPDLVSV
jgi:cytochrome P450